MRILLMIWLLQGALTYTQFAHSQGYPNKPVRFVVGYAPGGPQDILARTVGQPLSDMLGPTVVIDTGPVLTA